MQGVEPNKVHSYLLTGMHLNDQKEVNLAATGSLHLLNRDQLLSRQAETQTKFRETSYVPDQE